MLNDSFTKTIITDTNAIYLGVPIENLMEKAGEGIAEELIKKYGKSKSFNLICGLGNNGGDGFSAARYLAEMGVEDITVYLIGRVSNIKSSAAEIHWKKLKESKYIKNNIIKINSDAFSKDIKPADISVECLVGTGIKGKLHKRFNDVIVKITKQQTKMVAIDVPVPGYKHHFSISMLYPKTEDAVIVDIGMPKEAELYAGPGDVKVLDIPKDDSYKTQNGELLVFGGSDQFHGAPLMAIKAASKLVGSVFYYTTPENRKIAEKIKLEVEEFIVVDDDSLEKYANYANAFLFGPGLTDNLPTRAIITMLLRNFPDKPAILDAYAISVAREKGLLENRILTPHRGELRHIFEQDKGFQKLGDKGLEGKIKRFAVENQCYVLLKGNVDILFSKDGEIAFNKTGNPGMAKGGTGDILAGVLGAFLTKNDPWISMKAAAFITGKAGDNISEEFGYNYSATDIIPEIQRSIKWAQSISAHE